MRSIDAATLASLLDRRALIDALDRAFAAGAEVPPRIHHETGGAGRPGTLLIMPAWSASSLGVKLVTVHRDNAARGEPAVHATYALFDATTGAPRAVIDGTELTRRRTAAVSALAARYLAPPGAERLLMVGTGSLATHVIESHALVRPIRAVRIWGRRRERAAAIADRLAGRGFEVAVAEDLAAAVAWADIVSCATLATEPVVRGAWLRPGQHVDLIGAYTPQMREIDDEGLRRARIYVDTRAGALAESGELVQAIAAGVIAPADLAGELADLARGRVAARRDAQEITVFKSVGTALADLAAAELAIAASDARARGDEGRA
ncbi:MAG: ornithine cyclodeaminase family protein [Gammaproteobacteria bacterium]|nr:ornithine cyclodeaminase family protein [Gammaproteobacteria bacterium]